MTSAPSYEDAASQIAAFEAKFGTPALHLACHAALAVAIDPDLLHLLRINLFLDPPEQLPYPIEARLLLSPLCHEVEDLYRMDPEVRDLLLKRLEADFDPDRMRDVATLLWQYLERYAPWIHRPELEYAQRLTALSFLAPEKAMAWLDQEEGRGTGGTLGRQWFVAMRQRLERQDATREEVTGPERPLIDPARLRQILLRLDYASQMYSFQRALRSSRYHLQAFLLHGAARYGQRWLLDRLIHGVPELEGAVHFESTLSRFINPEDHEKIARDLAIQAGGVESLDAQNVWSSAAEAILHRLRERAVVLVLDHFERLNDLKAITILYGLWLRLLSHVSTRSPPVAPHYVVMFLIDNTGATTAPGGVMATDADHRALLHYIKRLPALERFSAGVLRKWLRDAQDQLPSVLTEDIAAAISDIMANSDNGVPEQVFEHICRRCGVSWQEVGASTQPIHPGEDVARAKLLALAQECNDLLEVTGLGTGAWDALERIVAEMRALPDEAFPPLAELLSSEIDGQRLAAIVRLQRRPDPTYLQYLADRLAGEKPFFAQQAALALEQAALRLHNSFQNQVDQAITRAQTRLRPGTSAADSASVRQIQWILLRARQAYLDRLDPAVHNELDSAVRAGLFELGRRYDEMRAEMPFSDERTRALGRLATQMREFAPVRSQLIAELSENPSPGARLAAVILLQETPDSTFLPWLVSRLGEERQFIGYHAAVALSVAAEGLDSQYLAALEEALREARAGARRSRDPNQRVVLDRAEEIVALRRGQDPAAQSFHEQRLVEARTQIAELAQEFQRLHQTVQAGWPRTGRMEQIAEEMRPYSDRAYALLAALAGSDSLGERLAAVVFLQARPHPDYLDWLVQRFETDPEFIQWHAAVALLAAARQLAPEYEPGVRAAIRAARERLSEGPSPAQTGKLRAAEELLNEAETDLNTRAEGTAQSVERGPRPIETTPPEEAAKAVLQEVPEEAGRTSEGSDSVGVIPMPWKLWPNGSTLRIRFLDGDPTVQARVRQYALEWTRYANLHFRFLPGDSTEAAEVRVSFKEGMNWTYMGTDAKSIPSDRPTINFGWSTARTATVDIRPDVLHMFGYVLGLIREHQSPHADIRWNREVVYRDLAGPPNHWTHEQVDNTILRRYRFVSPPDYRPFDPESIMFNFTIPKGWTLNGFEAGINRDLSASDKAFIARLYPKRRPRRGKPNAKK